MKNLSLLFVTLLAATNLQAATYTYTGATGSTWQTNANWTSSTGVTYPVAGDTADFFQGGAAAVSVLGNGSAGVINFAPTVSTNAYTLGSGTINTYTLTLDNGSSDSAINQTSADKANNIINDGIQIAGNDILDVTNSKGAVLDLLGTVTAASGVPTTLNVTNTVTGGTTLVASLNDTGNLTVNLTDFVGGGQIQLAGNNTTNFAGNINVLAGYVVQNTGNALGTTGMLTIGTAGQGTSSNATFNINGKSTITKNFTLYGYGDGYSLLSSTPTTGVGALENASATAAAISGTVTLGSNANIYVVSGSTFSLSGVVSGASNLIMGSATASDTTGTGSLLLSAQNTFSGGLTVNAGSVIANSSTNTTVFGTGNVIFGTSNTPTIDLNGHNATTGLLSGAGTNGVVTDGSATASTLSVSGTGSQTYAGVIKNGTGAISLSLLSTNTGTQTLSGTNTYTGATTVAGGTLNVTGSIASSSGTSVSSVLTGTGTVSGLTLNSTGNITPGTAGTSTGTLTGSSLTWNGGGTLTFQLNSTNNTSGLLSLSGGALTQGTAGVYGFNLTGGVGGLTYDLINFGSTTFSATQFSDLTSPTAGTFSILGGNELAFTVAVPEPHTWLMLLLGLAGLLVVRYGNSIRSLVSKRP